MSYPTFIVLSSIFVRPFSALFMIYHGCYFSSFSKSSSVVLFIGSLMLSDYIVLYRVIRLESQPRKPGL